MSNLSGVNKPSIRLSQKNLDVNDPNLKTVLDDIQGNILKSHGRSHSRHIFLKFTGNPQDNRIWLEKLASKLTSAYKQHQTSLNYKSTGTEHLFTGILLSNTGYKALGIAEYQTPDDKAFRAGMKDLDFLYDTGPNGVHERTSNPLNDNPNTWKNPFNNQVDLLIVLAYGGITADENICNDYLESKINNIKSTSVEVASILSIEKGYTLRNSNNDVIEHFGFVDGLSNPTFFKSDFDHWQNKEGTTYYDPTAPFDLVALNDPGGFDEDLSFGSYVVYRKMQQNIKGFKDQAKKLATEISQKSGVQINTEYSESLAFGRNKDGSPLIQSTKTPSDNNFSYQEDMKGAKCPFHSHIRKTNPRGDTNRLKGTLLRNERSHRIVRRGISYGSKNLSPEKEWTDAGLLFLSCQSDIEQQFLVTQCGWSDNSNFPANNVGHDPITGDQNAKPNNNKWQHEIDGKLIDLDFRYKNLVKVLGGEYFFAPSISFFKNLTNKSFNSDI
ncbi:Dyp-type peroxidase family [Tenacibaculum sp. MAR_2009_124]|uniref:Dyp-type peroxidase n=1 Tax=Tenacibaculum sp. MAR_2009_124 TaxID=1250059 RepID=UPI00089C4D2A|nr:Dyp-type peroxidase domain-containing protein [Tenacibaculum sp. MAR_2009_124]SED18992.1 Dyp-type peroxidase family [Tenacibaculum sp. MAR_2009_124]